MSKIWKEMEETARKGYIDDLGEISYAINAISRRTLAELQDMVSAASGEDIQVVAKDLIYVEYNGKLPKMSEISIVDLLCLLEYTQLEVSGTDEEEKDRVLQPYRYVGLYYLLRWFLEAAKNDYRFRVFCAAQIEQFFRCQERYSCRAGRKRWEAFQKKAAEVDVALTSSTTVKEILVKADEIQRKRWNPWCSIQEYQAKILAAYGLCSDLLIGSFQCIYPRYFIHKTVLQRYQCCMEEMDAVS